MCTLCAGIDRPHQLGADEKITPQGEEAHRPLALFRSPQKSAGLKVLHCYPRASLNILGKPEPFTANLKTEPNLVGRRGFVFVANAGTPST
jgi:hypothetical protein